MSGVERIELSPSLTPNDLGSGCSWGSAAELGYPDGDLLWNHLCNGRSSLGHIDVMSGKFHRVISRDPLHIEASVLCPDCGLHGFIRDGKWVSA